MYAPSTHCLKTVFVSRADEQDITIFGMIRTTIRIQYTVTLQMRILRHQ